MIHFRTIRYGAACALAMAAAGMLASCVSGLDSSGDGGQNLGASGQQGNPAPGNGGGSSVGGQPDIGGSAAVTESGGSPSAQGGSDGSAGTSTLAGGVQGVGGAVSSAAGGAGAGGRSAGGSTGMGGATSKGGTTGMAGGATAAGGGPTGPQPLPAITGGSSGFATRYWDCCKPSCGSDKLSCSSGSSSTNNGQSACQGGSAFMCYSFEPFQDTSNQYVSYAFAASKRGCGSCYELQFTGHSGCSEAASCPGTATGLVYKTVYVQVINTGDIADDQFDLLIPGGGVGQFNACSNEWGTSDLGATYGGFLTGCNGSVSCTQTKCNSVFANKPDLLAGCNWFLNWYTAADNPQMTFKQVSCPKQLSDKSGMSG